MDRWVTERPHAYGRLSGGYTLEEAARVYRSRMAEHGLVCPGCGAAMSDLSAEHRAAVLSLVRCVSCGRGLVLEYRTAHPRD